MVLRGRAEVEKTERTTVNVATAQPHELCFWMARDNLHRFHQSIRLACDNKSHAILQNSRQDYCGLAWIVRKDNGVGIERPPRSVPGR